MWRFIVSGVGAFFFTGFVTDSIFGGMFSFISGRLPPNLASQVVYFGVSGAIFAGSFVGILRFLFKVFPKNEG